MTSDNVKRSAIIYAGYDYQTLHGLKILADWLSAPTRYQRVRFECDDADVAPTSLDDILALRADGNYEYRQVKYTPSPDTNPLTWDWLLKVSGKTEKSRSLIRKWFDALKEIAPERMYLAEVVTNRVPDRAMELCLDGAYLDYTKAEASTRASIESALGDADNAKWFFKRIQIRHSDKNYLNLEHAVTSGLMPHSDAAGVNRLMLRARAWAIFESEPPPDGWITLDLIRSILSTSRPEPIPQDFTIPNGYQVPDEDFHQAFLQRVKDGAGQVLALVGPPGRGKSTYLSFLCHALEEEKTPFVRHHYFLSLTDDTRDRLSSYVVTESLLGQVERFYGQFGTKSGGRPSLREGLAACAKHFQSKGKPLVIIIDGLDHVWRDNAADKRPLDEVFAELIPPPENAVVVVGTQPVDDAYLPTRFVDGVPRSGWTELPPMSPGAVRGYLEAQTTAGRLKPVREDDFQNQLTECALALHKLTRGHPLNVIYAVEQLINGGGRLWAWDVEQLPRELGSDVRTYYASIWNKLLFAQRDMLFLLATLPLYWPHTAFSEIAAMSGQAEAPVRAIEHLLSNTDAGLKPFHDSLIVFIKTQEEYLARVGTLLPIVERWLQDRAPETLRNTWLWSVQAQLGNPEPLINGLTRDWVLDRVTSGYMLAIPVRLLADAEQVAFGRRLYCDSYRLRNVKMRLLNGVDFQIADIARLKACSWKLTQDESVLAEAFASRHDLEVKELTALAMALHWRRESQRAIRCGGDALRRHRSDSRYLIRDGRENWGEEVVLLSTMVGNLDLLDEEAVGKAPALNGTWREPVIAYLAAVAAKGELSRILGFAGSARRAFAKKEAEDASVRAAALSGARLQDWAEFNTFQHSSLAGCWAYLTSKPLARTPSYPLATKWNDTPGLEEERRWLKELVHGWFFRSVLTQLLAAGPFSWLPTPKFQRRPLISTYLDALTDIAVSVAEKWRSREVVTFGEIYKQFKRVSKPANRNYDVMQAFYDFSRALLPIVRDSHFLSVAVGGLPKVKGEDMASAEDSDWFSRNHFLSSYVEDGLPYLEQVKVGQIVKTTMTEVASQISDTYERTQLVLELCEMLLMHRMNDDARPLCRLCWDYVLGYGNHKDVAIISALEAIGDLAERAPKKALAILTSISAQVHHVTEYTDGDETRHAHTYADEILAKWDPAALVEKYKEHVALGDWHRADDALKTFFETCDLRSPGAVALGRTGLPNAVLDVVRTRDENGEDGASALLTLAIKHLGKTFERPNPEEISGNTEDAKGFEGRPEEYPPEQLNVLLEEMEKSQTFDAYSYLPKWFEYWERAGRGSDLLKVVAAALKADEIRERNLQYVLDAAFALCVKLKGPAAAFDLAVKAQIELGGWSEFFMESREDSQTRLRLVAKYYPERADEFIAKSAKTWLRHKRQPSPVVIPGEKLVFFLVQLNRIDEAERLVQEMATALLQETRNLPLTRPQWAANS